jgi:hypothetical protein
LDIDFKRIKKRCITKTRKNNGRESAKTKEKNNNKLWSKLKSCGLKTSIFLYKTVATPTDKHMPLNKIVIQ